MTAHGLLLAAGAGRRMGLPKALVRNERGEAWLNLAVSALLDGGCPTVTVVLGASADEAGRILAERFNSHDPVRVVDAPDWTSGLAASLRVGLSALESSPDSAAVVHLVDLPDVGASVIRRLLDQGTSPAVLARAAYEGRAGHPVLLGRQHWSPIRRRAAGDQGARAYLSSHKADLVECGDLSSGADIDCPPQGGPRPWCAAPG